MQIQIGNPVASPHRNMYELVVKSSSGVSHGDHQKSHMFSPAEIDELEKSLYLMDGYRQFNRGNEQKLTKLFAHVAQKYDMDVDYLHDSLGDLIGYDARFDGELATFESYKLYYWDEHGVQHHATASVPRVERF